MTTKTMCPEPETDALSTDPAIERRDVPARVWRKMAEIERQRDEAMELLRDVNRDAWTDEKGMLRKIARYTDTFLTRLEKERQP